MNISTWDKAMQRMIAFRGGGQDHRFFDIGFASFMRNPFPALDQLYAFIGEPLTDETRAHMQAWRDASPRDRYGRHQVDLALFGIDSGALDARFAYYHDRFAAMFDEGDVHG
jgi:hypothetical protein